MPNPIRQNPQNTKKKQARNENESPCKRCNQDWLTREKSMSDTPPPTAKTDAPHPLPARRGNIGRPTKRTPATVRKICRGIAEGLPFKFAAVAAGVSEETFCKWRAEFADFNEAVQQAVASGITKRLKQIKRAGDEGDWKAAAWWLEHVVPSEYAKSRIELEHIGKIEHTFTVPLQVLNEISEARKREEAKRIEPE